MRLRVLTPLVLLALSACWDTKHPGEMVGVWVRDTLYGNGILHAIDTLRLGKDGMALRSGSTELTALATNPGPPKYYAEGLRWAYRPRAGGPLVCFFVAEGQDSDCHTVRIASESLLVVDGNSYRRMQGR